MKTFSRLTTVAAIAAATASTAAVASQPIGVWIDHTGRGAVEIAECSGGNGGLCGHVVWVKDSKNKSACRTQIIGNAKLVGSNTWDRGWIIDPEDNARYSVELKPMGEDRLRVTGYMGTKLFSETMVWKRAPATLERCDIQQAATPSTATPPQPAAPAPSAAVPTAPASPSSTPKATEASPFESAPAAPTPQREAAAPSLPPAAAPSSAATEPQATPSVRTPAAPRVAEAEPQEEASPRRNVAAKRKNANKECRLELPYVTLKYPCDAF